MLHNIKQEYKRLQKRRHLENTFQQADSSFPLELQSIHSGTALPGKFHDLCSSEMVIKRLWCILVIVFFNNPL